MSRRSASVPHAAPTSSQPTPFPLWLPAVIVVLLLFVYGPALRGGLLWDDPGHVTRPDLQSLDGLRRIWFEIGATQQYYPLLHSAFWLEHKLWGDATVGYHLVNLLQHATAACLFAALLRRLAVPGAALAALLFAFHPVCVESVAWISEQKNTLSALFYLSAALAFLQWHARLSAPPGRDHSPPPLRYALATTLFVAALLTKTVTATLPAALLVVLWWKQGRLDRRRDILPLLPWFALSIGAGWLTAHFERELIGAQGEAFALGAGERLLLAGRVVWFYFAKLLWPADLTFIYPRWEIEASVGWQWLFPAAAAALLLALWQLARKRPAGGNDPLSAPHSFVGAFKSGSPVSRRAPLAAALLFGGTLFPVLGFFNVYPFLFSYVADHFQYLATLPVFALVAAGATRLAQRFPRPLALAVAAAVIVVYGTLSHLQSGMYRDVFTLYRTTLAQNPSASLAHNNLAVALVGEGRPAEALPHLEAAIQLRPDYAEAYANLGDVLTQLGRPAEAVERLTEAVRLQPNYAQAHNNLGVALGALDRSAEAMESYRTAIRLEPGYARAHYNLGLALAKSNRPAEALPHFARAVALDPEYADAELSWGLALMLTDRFAEAVSHFDRALELNPDSVAANQTYARALARHGRLQQALTYFRRAVELAPEVGALRLDLAFALRQLGQTEEAQHHFAEARRLGAQ